MTDWVRRVALAVGMVALIGVAFPPAFQPELAMASGTVRWGYYVTYADTSETTLRAHVDQLTHVSPWYFRLNVDGSITSMEQPSVTRFIRSRNVKVVPMIQNVGQYDRFRETLGTPEKMRAAVERVAAIAMKPEYDGIHIDFEGIDYQDRGLLTEFMAQLSGRLRPAGKLVTQAIAAKTVDRTTGWAAAFDYEALARYNDLIVVMAYDFHSSGGEPGPIAPLSWVEQVVRYTVSHFGPSRTVLGVPLYGYDWVVNKTPRPRAQSVSYSGALDLAQKYNAERGYDGNAHSEWMRFKVAEDDHVVWFESARSLRPKLELAREYRLAGFGSWRLGHEDPAFWAVVQELGTPASPVPPVTSTASRIYFPETRHTLQGGFLSYWRQRGGLARFGYPLTEEFSEVNPQDGQTYTVQYFERARFEYHPEFAGTEHEVLLGHIGRWAMERNKVAQWAVQPPPENPEVLYFPETGQWLSYGFRAYWEEHGGLAQFGLPLTGEFREVNPDTGEVYTVQYFERARFEWHPEHQGTPYEVLLGLLGRQVLVERNWVR